MQHALYLISLRKHESKMAACAVRALKVFYRVAVTGGGRNKTISPGCF